MQFYRIGGDIFEVGTGRKIGPTEWNSTWSGRATEVKAPPDPNNPDMTNWSDTQRTAWGAFVDYISSMKSQGKTVNPNITVDDATINRFMDQAKREAEPYYRSVINQTQAELNKQLRRMSEDFTTQEKGLESQYGRALESTQDSFARRGLEFSSDRTKAENDLASDTSRALQGLERGTMRNAEDTVSAGAKFLGSRNLQLGNFQIDSTGLPTMGQPGQYGFTRTGGKRSLFQQPSETYGELERNRLIDEEQRKNQLLAVERGRRGLSYL